MSRNQPRKHKAVLTDGNIPKQLMALTWPSMGGSVAIMIFNLTDTYFVSRLGTDNLAAMGFTFPIVMIIGAMAAGISLGAGSLLSRAMGSGDRHTMQRTATDGVMLAVFFVMAVSAAGILSLDRLFYVMGARGEVLDLVKQYMFIWYSGAFVIIIPPVSDSCLRATGDMMRPFIVMVICAVMNVIFDPIFIFGLGPIPAMGIQGAALATVISRLFGMAATLGFLHFHAGLVDFSRPGFDEIAASWKNILHVGLPSAFTQLLPPLSRAVLTRMAAYAGGATAVAAVAAGTRIEGLNTIFIMAFSMALVPMVGQNWGAGKCERVKAIRDTLVKTALVFGLIFLAVIWVLAAPAARIFSTDPDVVEKIVPFLRIIIISTGGLGLYTWAGQFLNAAGKPRNAALIQVLGNLVFIIPLSVVGVMLYGFNGLAAGFTSGQLLTAAASWIILKSSTGNLRNS